MTDEPAGTPAPPSPSAPPPTRPGARPLASRLVAAAFAPRDIAGLALFRIVFGLLALVSCLRFFAYGWIADFFVTPTFHFKYWGFSWVQAWPARGMYLHFGALTVLAAAITLGLYHRAAAIL